MKSDNNFIELKYSQYSLRTCMRMWNFISWVSCTMWTFFLLNFEHLSSSWKEKPRDVLFSAYSFTHSAEKENKTTETSEEEQNERWMRKEMHTKIRKSNSCTVTRKLINIYTKNLEALRFLLKNPIKMGAREYGAKRYREATTDTVKFLQLCKGA